MERKTCSTCGEEKPVTAFTFRNVRSGRRHAWCRDCSREQVRMHYQAHQAYYVRKARTRTARILVEQREWILNYLSLHPCVDCGEADPRCLDFDHIRGRKVCVISLMLGKYGWKAIEKEIAKCEVRCANCHRKRTAERRGAKVWVLRRP